MITDDDLRATLTAHAADIPPADDRLGQVRLRLHVARRRRVAGAGMVAVVIALVAVLVPVTARSAGPHRVTPAVTQTPWPTYAAGGRALAGTQLTSRPGRASQTFSFVPTSYLLVIRVSCAGSSTDTVEITTNGSASSFSGGCGAETGTTADAAAGAGQWSPFIHLGRVNTVTVTRHAGPAGAPGSSQAGGEPVPGGTITAAIYQGVPLVGYPLPPKPSVLRTLAPEATQRVALDSRHHFQTAGFYDWANNSYTVNLTPSGLASYGIHATAGQRVTVTVTAAHFTGPYWLISVG